MAYPHPVSPSALQPAFPLVRAVLAGWQVKDSNLRRNTPADLQSAPIGRSGNLPSPTPAFGGWSAGRNNSKAGPEVRIRQRPTRRAPHMADSSFDIVSKLDRQEVDNALGQAAREIATRFDFKGTGATIEWQGEHAIEISASADDRASAVLDVFKDKLVKRQQSLKILDASEPRQSGQQSKISIALKEGISSEDAKKISKLIRDEGPKGVKAQIQGDELRISSKKRDDLQAVQALVKQQDYDFAVQFTNYR